MNNVSHFNASPYNFGGSVQHIGPYEGFLFPVTFFLAVIFVIVFDTYFYLTGNLVAPEDSPK
ncbi:hypothetical protein [Desulfosporosinus sp. OT]|uniref:hypothetical protein n=1 Tax=Desulfosporosinus sp. OT TaxID=913865 RepID=UPI000223B09C|nr:hypothetical protein [Desulfosporosinus sp. OT]EGW38836.1 hypothetical protein DOT_2957 [Desulfosporosinus sp. OT]